MLNSKQMQFVKTNPIPRVNPRESVSNNKKLVFIGVHSWFHSNRVKSAKNCSKMLKILQKFIKTFKNRVNNTCIASSIGKNKANLCFTAENAGIAEKGIFLILMKR